MADVTEVLSHQHREVESLFEQFDAAASDEHRGVVARAIIENLSKLAALEVTEAWRCVAWELGSR
jgi:hypothetical protein